MKADQILDVTGLSCPMPIVRTKKAVDGMQSGQIIEIHATDKGSSKDLTAWANTAGHEIMDSKEEEGIFKFWIKKA